MSKEVNIIYIVAIESITNNILRAQVLEFLKDLSSSTINFVLLGFADRRDTKSRHEIAELRKDLMEHNIQTHIYIKSRIKIVYILQSICMLLKSMELVIRKGIHAIQGRGYINGIIGLVLKYLFQIKLIIDCRGTPNEEMVIMNRWKNNGLMFRTGMRVEKYVLERADHIFCVSEAFLDYMRWRNIRQDNIDIIPCCPSEDFLLSAARAEGKTKLDDTLNGKFVIVYSGSLGKWNVIEPMLDFFSVVSGKIDAHFLFLTPDVESSRKLFEERNYPLEIYTILEVDHKDIANYLKRSDLALMLREHSVINYVASPVKMGEYLVCGVPVVGTPHVGAFKMLVSQYNVGFTIELEDIRNNPGLLDKIAKMVKDNREEYREHCINCAQAVFLRKNYVSEYIKAYTDKLQSV